MFFPLFPMLAVSPVDRQRWDVGATVARALAHAEIPRKVAADLMHISEDALARQLAGRYCDHIALDALSCLPAEFWVWFTALTLEHYGLFPGTRTIVARAVTGGLRMARATLARGGKADGRDRVVA